MKKKHIPISIVSFGVLLVVQYLLIYNTFALRNNQYQVLERKSLDSAYRALLLNDKVFPGGQRIIDSLIRPQYDRFRQLQDQGHAQQTAVLAERLTDTILRALRTHSNMDTIFSRLILENGLDANLSYCLLLTGLEMTLDGKQYLNLLQGRYRVTADQPYLVVDGTLQDINKQNLITSLTVSSPQANSYKIGFALHADDPDSRYTKILRQMTPTLLLAFIAIFLVVAIYYLTYRNWIRQKKMAEMTSDFLNSITHEFHTPITTITVASKSIGNMALMQRDEKISELSSIITRQSTRLQNLVKQALNITELNTYNIKKESYPIYDLMAESIDDYRLAVEHNVQISMRSELGRPALEISLNKFLFTTAVFNIFDNAIKYNRSANKVIAVSITETNGEIGIHIADNGIGLDEKQYQAVFQKFYRGKESGYMPGLGLGLFYVQKVAEAHGWRVEVRSSAEQGTTFTIWIASETN